MDYVSKQDLNPCLASPAHDRAIHHSTQLSTLLYNSQSLLATVVYKFRFISHSPSSSFRSSRNAYYATVTRYRCVFVPLAIRPSPVERAGSLIECNNLCGCRACKGKTKAWTVNIRQKVLYALKVCIKHWLDDCSGPKDKPVAAVTG